MKLISVRIFNYKSIEDSTEVPLGQVTCLVGKNESGKTAFLEAVRNLNSVNNHNFNAINEYPRRKYAADKSEIPTKVPIKAKFELDESDKQKIGLFSIIELNNIFLITKDYKNDLNFEDLIDLENTKKKINNRSDLPNSLKEKEFEINYKEGRIHFNCPFDETVKKYIEDLNKKFGDEIRKLKENVQSLIPKFLYFNDYSLLPGKISKNAYQSKKNQKKEEESDNTFQSFLEIGGVSIDDIFNLKKYEEYKATIESAQISISEEVFKYWRQNKNLEVELELIDAKKEDMHPFNTPGDQIFHFRIKNIKNKVSLPFDQRSKGFVWFFSFLCAFKKYENQNVILLLDEPGLSLHAKAQEDFLNFIYEKLSKTNQIIYTTHSPFMIKTSRIEDIKLVEDNENKGTVISNQILNYSKDTIFPLQSALGYDIAQNMFIGKNNLVVEGVSDYLYLSLMSDFLKPGGLNEKWIITPIGGADKINAFISLFRGNNLNIVVLLDESNKISSNLNVMIQKGLLKDTNIISLKEILDKKHADIEDIFSSKFYLELFCATHPKFQINFEDIQEHKGKILDAIRNHLNVNKEEISHLKPAQHFAKHPELFEKLDRETIDRFKYLFSRVNALIDLN